jgi:GNAT superfamily N-acetyltransferase
MIAYRAVTLDELPIAAELRQEMGQEMGSDLEARGNEWRAKFCIFFGTRIAQDQGCFLLAFDDGRPVGMVAISLTDEWRAFCFGMRFAFINAVYVKPDYRRRGIGRELMNRAIAWARDRRCNRVRLRTSEDGRALYESVGFVAGREMELEL